MTYIYTHTYIYDHENYFTFTVTLRLSAETLKHSCYSLYGSLYDVVVGMHNQSEDGGKYYRIIHIIETVPHEDYNRRTQDSDIMLLKLAVEVDYNDGVKPVCLAEQGAELRVKITEEWSRELCMATGWGELEGGFNRCSLKLAVLMRISMITSPLEFYFSFSGKRAYTDIT